MPYNKYHYNEVKFKSSHNSYNRDEHILDQIEWKGSYEYGCRGLEFDLSQSEDGRHFSVGHLPWYNDDAPHLSQYLNELRVWSMENPLHDCLTIHLDLKSCQENFIEELDQYISKYLDEGSDTFLLKPGEFTHQSDSLIEGLSKHGWPSLNDLRGKFIFCISGGGKDKEKYANHNFKERLCFADVDININEIPKLSNQVFLNYKLNTWNETTWQNTFQLTKNRYSQAIIRGYVLNNSNIWNDAINSKCNILSTNKICHHEWSLIGDTPFVKI